MENQPKPKKSLLKKGVMVFVVGFAVNLTFILTNIGGILRELSRLAVFVGMVMMVIGLVRKIFCRKSANKE